MGETMAHGPDLNTFAERVNGLAPLPALALRVLQLVEDERSSVDDFATAMAPDAALTARLLRLANSVYYSPGRTIATVREAVILLGTAEIRRLVLTTSLMDRYAGDPNGPISVPAFWGHSLAVAMVAEVMARHTRLALPEEAFTAGILHDLGKLVMTQYEADRFSRAVSLATTRALPLESAEAEVFGFTHAQLGGRLGQLWRLPVSICDAILRHHTVTGEEQGLAHVVAQANDLCRDHGLWCGFEEIEPGAVLPETPGDDPLRAGALARLGGIERIVERIDAFLSASRPAAPTTAGVRHAHAPGGRLRSSPWALSDRFPGRGGRLAPAAAGR
jgi:putative nucleotidyltransferase with HDIG domain